MVVRRRSFLKVLAASVVLHPAFDWATAPVSELPPMGVALSQFSDFIKASGPRYPVQNTYVMGQFLRDRKGER